MREGVWGCEGRKMEDATQTNQTGCPSAALPHLDHLAGAELQPVAHIKGVDHEEEEHGLIEVLNAVAKDEHERKGDRRNGDPKVGDIDLPQKVGGDTTSVTNASLLQPWPITTLWCTKQPLLWRRGGRAGAAPSLPSLHYLCYGEQTGAPPSPSHPPTSKIMRYTTAKTMWMMMPHTSSSLATTLLASLRVRASFLRSCRGSRGCGCGNNNE